MASNTILQKSGAAPGSSRRAAFATCSRSAACERRELYDLTWEKPEPLVRAGARLEVDERIAADGSVVAAARRGRLEARGRGAGRRAASRSIAICFINGYANPAHERPLGASAPAAPGSARVASSARCCPRCKEYERTSTTVVNAYLLPVDARAIWRLRAACARIGIAAPLLVMQSNGGVIASGGAAERPVYSSAPARRPACSARRAWARRRASRT